MAKREATFEELQELYREEVCKRQDLEKERDTLQNELRRTEDGRKCMSVARDAALAERDKAAEARDQFQKRVEELDGERVAALQRVEKLGKCAREAETELNLKRMELTSAKDQIAAQEEVIERLKAQNARFVEEQREAKQRADATAASLIKAREEVARLVELNDAFKERLAKVTKEKNDIVEISNGFARERDAIQAEYDARGKVIKKLRKRLHKLKKKLKH